MDKQRIIEIEDDEKSQDERIGDFDKSETIKVSIGSGSLRSSVVVSKHSDIDEYPSQPHDERETIERNRAREKKTSRVNSIDRGERNKPENRDDSKYDEPKENTKNKDDSKSKPSSNRNDRRSPDRKRRSPERRRERSRSPDNRDRRNSQSGGRRYSQRSRSPPRRRSPSYRSRYQPPRREVGPRWGQRGMRGRYEPRRSGRYNDRGRGRGRGYGRPYGNSNYDSRSDSRRSRDERPERRDRPPRRRSESPRKARKRSSSSSGSTSSSSSGSEKENTEDKKTTNDKKLSREEKDKIMKELEEIEHKKSELKKNRRTKKKKEGNAANDEPSETIESAENNKNVQSSAIKVAIHTPEQEQAAAPAISHHRHDRYTASEDFRQTIEKYKNIAKLSEEQPSRAANPPIRSYEEEKPTNRMASEQSRVERMDVSDNVNNQVRAENMDDDNGRKRKKKKSKKRNRRLSDEDPESETVPAGDSSYQREPYENDRDAHRENEPAEYSQEQQQDSENVEENTQSPDRQSMQSNDEKEEESSSSGNESSGQSDDADSSDSSGNESESSSESEPVKKKKRKSKKKKKKREASSSSDNDDSSSEGSSSEEQAESSEEEVKRHKKKRKKKKKKRSKKRKSKKSKKNKPVFFDPRQLMSWMEEQKEKMREELLNELGKQPENNADVTSNTKSSKRRAPFDELAKDAGKDAEIADSDSDVEMEKKDGYPTGIPLKKEDKQQKEVSKEHNSDMSTEKEEEVFTLFKSDDELDYDLDENNSTEEENWKRRSSREKDAESLKPAESNSKTSDVKRHGKSPSRSKRERSREHRGKESRSSRTREHHKHESKRESDVKTSSKKQSEPSRSRISDQTSRPSNSDKKKEEQTERPHHRRSSADSREKEKPPKEKVSEKYEKDYSKNTSYHPNNLTDESKHESRTSIRPDKVRPKEKSHKNIPIQPTSVFQSSDGFLGTTKPAFTSPPSGDGIAIANQVRNNAVKRDDFWKGDSLKRPIGQVADVFERADQVEKEVIGIPTSVNTSEGHWEAPFKKENIQARLQNLADPMQLYDSVDPLTARMNERDNRPHGRDDGRKPLNSGVEYVKDDNMHNSPALHRVADSKRYSENVESSMRRNIDRYNSRNENNDTSQRRFAESRGDGRDYRKDEHVDVKRNNEDDYRNRPKSYPPKDSIQDSRFHDRMDVERKDSRTDYRPRDSDKIRTNRDNYKRTDSSYTKDNAQSKDRSRYTPPPSSNRAENRHYSRSDSKDFRDKTSSSSMDYRDVLNKKKDISSSRLFSANSPADDPENEQQKANISSSYYTRPEKNYRSSKRR